MKLVDRKCVPCEGGAAPLAMDEARLLGEQTPEWEIAPDHIERTYQFADFVQAMEFANGITRIAEEENHHPDLHISWGKARVELSTHSIGGLSENDFIVAAKIDELYD